MRYLTRLNFLLSFVLLVFLSPLSAAPNPTSTTPDISSPDVLIVTNRLSRLPHDILSVSLLKSFLTEESIFYYEQNEDFLGLQGALRRISFEHDLTLSDRLMAYLIDAPAELAFWRGPGGKLDHFMIVVNQSGLKSLLEMMAKTALDDKQLSMVPGTEAAPRFALRYGVSSTLYLSVVDNQLFAFTDPQMVLPTPKETNQWSERLQKFFGFSKDVGVFSRLYGLSPGQSTHSVIFSLRYLSFGYNRFLAPSKALRFDFGKQGWKTWFLSQTEAEKKTAEISALWHAIPHSPGLCIASALDAQAMKGLLESWFSEDKLATALKAGPLPTSGALCWYSKSKLYSPLLIAKFDDSPEHRELLTNGLKLIVGNREAGITEVDASASAKVGPSPQVVKRLPPFPLLEKTRDSGVQWTREVSSRYGIYERSRSERAAEMRSLHFFRTSAALWRGHFLFSADDRLVTDAMAVLDKNFPAVSDVLPDKAVALVVYPSELGKLLQAAVLDSLPSSQESVFREAVSRKLFPAFERLNPFPGYSLGLPPISSTEFARWGEAKWRPLSGT